MLAPGESERVACTLERLAPHLDLDAVALTGGIAVEQHLAAAGCAPLRTNVADVDLVAEPMQAVKPSVAGVFLVSHYHTAGRLVPKAIVQLVDAQTRLRIDVFPDVDASLLRARRSSAAFPRWRVLDAHAVYAHKLQTIRRSAATGGADREHWLDAAALAAAYRFEAPEPAVFAPPECRSTDASMVCARCELSRTDAFPLAPKAAILASLGYV